MTCIVVIMLTLLISFFKGLWDGLKGGGYTDTTKEEKPARDDLNSLYRALEYQQARLANLEQLERLIEEQYQTETDPAKQARLLSRMITLDNQIYTTQTRIEALKQGIP